ncbi:MAG: PUR family DNA/RNA-binding protein [Flavobacteriales bacterium]|nr:PUR family DNA/RNA-binding protein [Flavobacteriales bacterium]
MEDKFNREKSDRYSKSVKAGKRTYFFDVKSTKDENLYITITESKRKPKPNGDGFYYEKHKVFLYKEDLVKFTGGLAEVVDYVRKNNPTPVVEQTYTPSEIEETGSATSDIDFDDLGN